MSDVVGAPAADNLGALARPGSRILLVGVGSLPPGSPLPAVPAVEPSLKALAVALRERGGVPDDNLRVLVDPPSPLEFGAAVDLAADEASDALLVHVVGHGLVGSDNGLYLATCATDDLVDGLSYKALAYQALHQAIQRSRARAVAVILDCCFSGRAEAPLGPPALDAVFEQTLVRGGFLLASTAREEHGLARPGEEYTAFTGALIRLIRNGDPTGPAQLTLDHAYRYLNRVLPEEDAPRPRRLSSNQAGELVLASNCAYRPHRPTLHALEPATSDAEAVTAPCPFRGLESFRAEDSRYFFGRKEAIENIARLVRGGGLIAVVGASGSGKTSLLRAGLIPELEARSEGWTVAAMKPGTNTPTTALAQRSAALTGHDRAVLLVDQFEELFTSDATEEERERFVTGLAALAHGSTTVVIAVRADFYEGCTHYPGLVRALEGRQVIVDPLRPEQLREVIERPAETAGLFLQEGLADTLLHDARVHHAGEHTAVLPLLSHALLATWQKKSGTLLTLTGYRATGGIDKAIARTAEDTYKALDSEDQPHVRGLLLRLVRLSEGMEDTRRRLFLGDLAVPARRVLQALAEARLITVDADDAEIVHEALLYAWPRLRAWIEEDRVTLLTLQQLSDAARAWDQAGRQQTDLYRGHRLDSAALAASEQRAKHDTDGVLGPVAHDFLNRSLELRDRQQHAARRARRTRRMVIATVCVLALLGSVVSFISVREHGQAVHQAALIHSTDLAADASALNATDPGLAAQLAIGAYRSAPTRDATTQLYTALAAPLDSVVGDTGHEVLRIATQRDGNLAAASSTDGSVRIWDLTSPSAPVLEATLHTAGTAAVALAPRGKLLAAFCPTAHDLCLWNLTAPRKPSVVGRLPQSAANPHALLKITSMAINSDATLLAASSSFGTTLVWSIAEPAHPRLVAELPIPTSRKSDAALGAVAFSPRDDLLATTILGGKTRLWDLSHPSAPAPTATVAKGYAAVAFNLDGTMLSAVGDKDFGLWRTGNPSKPRSVKIDDFDFTGSLVTNLLAVDFSPDGTRLAVSGLDTDHNNGQLCLLSLSPERLTDSPSPTCTPTGFGTLALAYLRGGAILSGGPDGVVRSWRTALPQVEDVNVPYLPSGWDFSHSGHLMVGTAFAPSSSPPSSIGVWDISASRRVATIKLSGTVEQADLIGDDKALLSVATDGRVQLWDLHDPHHPVRGVSLGTANFPTLGEFIISTGVFADGAGDLVTVPGSDGRVQLWRITDARHAAKAGFFRLPASEDWSGILEDGRTAFVATPKGIEWWDTTDPRHPVRGDTTQLAHANEKGLIASGNVMAVSTPQQPPTKLGNTIRLFQVTAGKVRVSTSLQGNTGTRMEMSDGGQLLAATGNGDGTVRLWDISDPRHPGTGTTLRTLNLTRGIVLDPRNHLMADWNSDDGIQLWDIHNPTQPVLKATIQSLKYVEDLDFLPANSALAVARSEGVTFYSTDLAGLADLVCSYTGKSMPEEQWQKYAPGIPYLNQCPSHER